MQYGFVIPGGDIHLNVELACEAEQAGWDGVFIPDCIYIPGFENELAPTHDPWIVLAAMATRTTRVRLGTMITPLSRRRPWKVARETMSLDHLSHGRLILPVGLGALDDAGFGAVGDETDKKVRAQMLDESLEILAHAWSGEQFRFEGEHYQVKDLKLLPRSVQQPRIPVWVVGAWPSKKSMKRVARWDGWLPNKISEDGQQGTLTPEDIRAGREFIGQYRSEDMPFDIIMEGETPGDEPAKAADIVGPWAEAGCTWWMDARWNLFNEPNGVEILRERIRQGPPR